MKEPRIILWLALAGVLILGVTAETAWFGEAHAKARASQPDGIQKLIDQGIQEDSIGHRPKAVALTNQAVNLLLAKVADSDTRARLEECAMDLCCYGRRGPAAALLARIKGYPDAAGQQAALFYTEITHNDGGWRTVPVPDAATIAFRKEILKRRGVSVD